ncbi:MAG TPA: hypothetical protein VJT82_06750, partial [Pyrinomonadaceae bacterium]|nr:hypothetical protein [Pyrinomonadaceae bacterium]
MSKNLSLARTLAACLVVGILLIPAFTFQTPARAQRRGGARRAAAETSSTAYSPMRRDPEIARMIAEIDARNIERTIRKLVSFGTRNTLSAQDNPARGIGAARDWLFAELQKSAAQSGGRMTVEKQSYLQEAMPPPRGRVPQPTVITNVVATLRGTQGASSERMYVVSGHYDSMCGSPTNATCDAPGANDD